MLSQVFFFFLAVVAIAAGIGLVASRNPVSSALWLVLNLFCIAGLYITLNALFIGVIQVLVYAGAIMVLFLFVIMLLNLGHEDYRRDLRGTGWIAAGSAVFGLLAWMILGLFQGPTMLVDAGTSLLPAEAVAEYGAVGAVAMPMYQDYVVAFEATSLLLLAAIIGAILLAKRRA